MIGTLVASLSWTTVGGPPPTSTLVGGTGQALASVGFPPRVLLQDDDTIALLLSDGRAFVFDGEGWSQSKLDPPTDPAASVSLGDYRGPVWLGSDAWFGVEAGDSGRSWVRHELAGPAVTRTLVAPHLSGLLTQVRGVLPDGGAVIAGGRALIWMQADGTERTRHELPDGADIHNAVVDPRGATWVVHTDEVGAQVWRIALGDLDR